MSPDPSGQGGREGLGGSRSAPYNAVLMTHGEINLSPEHGSSDPMTALQGGCPSPPRPRCLCSEDLRDLLVCCYSDFPGGSAGKDSACNVGDPGSIPGSRRAPGEGNSKPLWVSCLGNVMDRGAWQATVHGVAKSRTGLSDFTFTFTFMKELKIFGFQGNKCYPCWENKSCLL